MVDTLLKAATLLSLVLGAIVGLWQISLLRKQIVLNFEWGKRERALSYSLTRNENVRTALIIIERHFGIIDKICEPIPFDNIAIKIADDDSLYRAILTVLGHLEGMAIAIHCDVIDELVVYEMQASIVVSYERVFKNFIDNKAKDNGRFYMYTVALAHAWGERLSGNQKGKFRKISVGNHR